MPPEHTTQPQKNPSDELPRIHTFQSDVEELLRKERVSKAVIAIAEHERQRERAEETKEQIASQLPESKIFHIESGAPPVARWNIELIATIAVGVLVLGGMSAGAFFFLQNYRPPHIEEPGTTAESLGADLRAGAERKELLETISSRVTAASVPQNEVRSIPVRLDGRPLMTAELFEKTEAGAPSSLVRALEPTFTLGIHGFRGGQPFLLFGVNSYDHAFDGMLAWESTMLNDIGPLFGIFVKTILGRVATTTSEALRNTIIVKDVVVRNKDTRVFLDPDGKTIAVYAFIDKETLVLTTSTDTLQFLLGRAGGGRLR